jgi:hypothetical protein
MKIDLTKEELEIVLMAFDALTDREHGKLCDNEAYLEQTFYNMYLVAAGLPPSIDRK